MKKVKDFAKSATKSVKSATKSVAMSVAPKKYMQFMIIQWLKKQTTVFILGLIIIIGAFIFAGNALVEWSTHNIQDTIIYTSGIILFVMVSMFFFKNKKLSILILFLMGTSYITYTYYTTPQISETTPQISETTPQISETAQNVIEKNVIEKSIDIFITSGNTIIEWSSHNLQNTIISVICIILFIALLVFVYMNKRLSLLILCLIGTVYLAYMY